LQLRSIDGSEQIALTTDGTERYDYARVPVDAVTARRHPENVPLDLAWSPDSKYILTSRLDERNVRDAYLIQSVPDDGSSRPALYSYPSAFVGDEVISKTPLLIVNVRSRQQTVLEGSALNAPSFGSIITGYAWWSQDGSKAYFVSRDRFWKSVTLHEFDAVSGKTREFLHETSDTMVRVNAGDPFGEGPAVRILRNGDVIWYSDRDGWGHLYYYNGATGKQRNQITKGDWQVSRIVRIDETHGCIYFMGRGRELNHDPYQQYLYRINFDGSGLRLLTPEPAEHSVAASMPTMGNDGATVTEQAGFSPSGRYFVDSYSRPDLPPVFVLRSADGQLVKTLEKADISELRSGGYAPIEPFHVLAADGKTAIYGNLFRPSTFDPTRKYPIIDASYPGPQMIRTGKSFGAAAFHPFESQSLAELGFIVVTIDGRGTPFRSKAFLDYSYGQLARASDLDDHIAGIRQLAQRYPYMDISRVGIDGVSAGGFVAAHALLAHPDFYKVAVAASGDHDLRDSSAEWGETYNGPLDAGNYQDIQNEHLAGNLRGRLLLMHGDIDDRCPPSQTLLLVDALIKKNRDFDLLIIPNGNHAAFMSPYFIRRKWDYFVRNLLDAEPPAGYEITLPRTN
jgi:dipeptidyl-peptidase-4